MEDMMMYQAQPPKKPLTAMEIKAQVQVIQQVMSEVMIKDVHYGTIPGTPKPTLYKPGSEKILATFHIAAYPKEVEDLSTDDEIRYRVKVHGLSGGELIGVGIGECSSSEEKYKWRKPVCDEEFNETPVDRRREVWKKGTGNNPPYKQKQIRTNPSDVANTVLKMAKKRSQIDMTLTATAASDVFDQDLEDLSDEVREGVVNGKAPSKSSTVTPAKKEAPPPGPGVMVTDVYKKDGKKKDGTPYTKYTIKTNQGDYNTFSETFSKIALDAKASSSPVVVTFKTGQYGNDLESIEAFKKPEPAPATDPIVEDRMTILNQLLDKKEVPADTRRDYCGFIMGHEIADWGEVTAEQADRLINALRAQLDGVQP